VILASVTSSITSAIGNHGIYAIFGLMLVDAVLPAASELVMLYAGALASGALAGQSVVLFGDRVHSGWPAFLAVVAAGTLGYIIGALIGWGIGAHGGRPLVEQRGRWLHLGPERLLRAERWFDRFGNLTSFVGRLTPVARSFVSIPAGVFRVPLGPYAVLTSLGSTIWCLAFAGAGWGLGSNWDRFHRDFRYVDYAFAAGVLALVVYLVVRRRSSRLAARRADDPAQ
jgi:membrane protein DedA with SNARE-associated domain